jgi:tetratricopeptide (TPR) repeat protein
MDSNDSKNSACPYKNVMKKFSFFNRDNDLKEETVNTTMDTEKGIEMSTQSEKIDINSQKCPYGFKDKLSEEESKESKESSSEKKNDKSNKEQNVKEDDDEKLSDEEEIKGGCPVMNKTKKDPLNKHFEEFFEIPRFGPFDFMYLMRGLLDHEEYLKKTEKVRKYPRHMKYTLFVQNQEKLQKVHEKEFPVVFFMYDDIKEKGNRLFRRKKFREAIEHYQYAYGLLKWIQFKDKKRQEDFLKKPTMDPILDEDIEEKHVYLDDVAVEEDSFKACVVYLLMNLSYAYLELRHYFEAIECLDECIEIAEEKEASLYFRRSQARTYNRDSSEADLEKAMQDIEKAIKLKEDESVYIEHKEILIKIINKKLQSRREKTDNLLSRAKKSYLKIKERNLNVDEVIYTKKDKDAFTQYKILKE